LNWGAIDVYTCVRCCKSSPEGKNNSYLTEFVLMQPSVEMTANQKFSNNATIADSHVDEVEK
jgi:hypothetical protein